MLREKTTSAPTRRVVQVALSSESVPGMALERPLLARILTRIGATCTSRLGAQESRAGARCREGARQRDERGARGEGCNRGRLPLDARLSTALSVASRRPCDLAGIQGLTDPTGPICTIAQGPALGGPSEWLLEPRRPPAAPGEALSERGADDALAHGGGHGPSPPQRWHRARHGREGLSAGNYRVLADSSRS